MPASNRFKLTCVLSLAAATTLALPLIAESPADYWPQWRAPNHVGSSSTAKDLPVGWSATENVVWRVRSPSWNAATPIIWGDYVFITSAEEGFNDALKFEPRGRPGGPRGKRGGPGAGGPGGGFGGPRDGPRGGPGGEGNQGGPRAGGPGGGARGEGRRRGPGGGGPGGPGGRRGGGFRQNARPESNEHTKLFLMALNRKDGSVMWRKETGDNNQIYRKQNMASPSPVTDGKHVWVMTGRGTLTSFDFDGNQQWRREIQEDYGAFGLNWGYASSPRLHEGRLYIQVLHGMTTDDPSYILAIDAVTGKTLWKVERPTDAPHESPDNYSTPILVPVEGKLQLVVSGGDYVTGHDLGSGKELWRLGGFNPNKIRANRTISSSVAVGDLVFTSSRSGRPFIGFRAGGSGDITGKNEVWTNNLGADVPTPTTDGETLYVVNDRGIVVSLDPKSGETIWERQRIEPGTYSSSPLLADGKIYATNEDGTTTVLKAEGEFEILAVNKLDEYTLSSPVAVGNQIFLRTMEHLYCFAKQ